MDSKVEFIEDWQANDLSFSELCAKEAEGISRTHQEAVPAESTIGGLLEREGLIHRRREPGKLSGGQSALRGAVESNDVWSANYKGGSGPGPGADANRCR
ncbi:MAG: hypothetical protein FJW39_25345 [Acidobacteria bacterium]|nr:hypothetical protein [Acidobacteriota bacterium]